MTNEPKIALVTGASSGIGRATAELFARRGYHLALLDRDEKQGRQTERAIREISDGVFLSCDVTDEAAVQAAIAASTDRFGRIDAAFNAAGIDGEMLPTVDSSTDNFERVMAVNLKGLWFCMKYQLQQMLRQGHGAIVNCASSAGLVGVPGLAVYAASKHGVVGLTRSAALENARNNIRINAVCPGMVDTPMWQRSISREMTAALLESDPSGRLGRPEEVAEAVLWLSGDSASYVNGHCLVVDGGMTVD